MNIVNSTIVMLKLFFASCDYEFIHFLIWEFLRLDLSINLTLTWVLFKFSVCHRDYFCSNQACAYLNVTFQYIFLREKYHDSNKFIFYYVPTMEHTSYTTIGKVVTPRIHSFAISIFVTKSADHRVIYCSASNNYTN